MKVAGFPKNGAKKMGDIAVENVCKRVVARLAFRGIGGLAGDGGRIMGMRRSGENRTERLYLLVNLAAMRSLMQLSSGCVDGGRREGGDLGAGAGHGQRGAGGVCGGATLWIINALVRMRILAQCFDALNFKKTGALRAEKTAAMGVPA